VLRVLQTTQASPMWFYKRNFCRPRVGV